MPNSSYVQGVPFPSSKQQQHQEAIARAAALHAQHQAKAQSHAAQQSQPQGHVHGQGFGVRVPLQQVPQHYHGKPAFYDASRGIIFDGHQAYYYQNDKDDIALTAIEVGHGGHQQHHQQQDKQQIFGQGYGARVPLIKSLQQKLYHGKPAFYDPVHAVYYDGKQAYLYVPTDGTSTAVELSTHGEQQISQGGHVTFGHGYGERVPLASHIAQQFHGKPAFYDSTRGILYDGQNLYAYQPGGAQEIQASTAIELASQQPAFHQQQRAVYQQLVDDMNNNRSVYLF